MYFSFLSFSYIILLYRSCDHSVIANIVFIFDIYIYLTMLLSCFTYLSIRCFFFLFIHMFLMYAIFYFLFHTKMP